MVRQIRTKQILKFRNFQAYPGSEAPLPFARLSCGQLSRFQVSGFGFGTSDPGYLKPPSQTDLWKRQPIRKAKFLGHITDSQQNQNQAKYLVQSMHLKRNQKQSSSAAVMWDKYI